MTRPCHPLHTAALCLLCAFAMQADPALAVQNPVGMPTVRDRLRSGLLGSVELRVQRAPQMEDLAERERRRPLQRCDRVGRTSYGAILDGASRLQDLARLHYVNSVWNSLRYASDRDLYGRDDYWATPSETARLGAGDCEDFAIAKYYTLRDLGHDEGSLRLALVTLRATGEPHMLLCVRARYGASCLDNRHKRLLSNREAALAYRPVLSANGRLAVMHLTPRPNRQERLAADVRLREPKAGASRLRF